MTLKQETMKTWKIFDDDDEVRYDFSLVYIYDYILLDILLYI